MKTLLDKQFDEDFKKVESLTWYPWVGKNYTKGKRRVLIIGESHYAEKEDGTPDEKCKEAFLNNVETTREIVGDIASGKEKWNYFKRIEKLFPREDLWSEISFFNLLQVPIEKKDDKSEKANNYEQGWRTFVEVVNILQPTDCIIMGLGSDKGFGKVMTEYGLEYQIKDLEKLTRSKPRYAKVDFKFQKDFELYFIQHSRDSIEPWQKFLKQQIPEAMEFLTK